MGFDKYSKELSFEEMAANEEQQETVAETPVETVDVVPTEETVPQQPPVEKKEGE